MIPAPLPSLFPLPKGLGDTLCSHLEAAVQFDVAFTQFMNWGFNPDGSFSQNFIDFITLAISMCNATTTTTSTTTTTTGTGTTTSTTTVSTVSTTVPTSTFTPPLPSVLMTFLPKLTQSQCGVYTDRNLFDQNFIAFYSWMVGADGNPTPAFATVVCQIVQDCKGST